MKLWLSLLVLAVSFTLCGGAAIAKEKNPDKPKPTAEEMFKKMDKNNDGKLTKDEFVAGKKDPTKAEAAWSKLAGDKESITLEEYKAAMQKRAKKADKKK